ncbi:MAG: histidine phosphatase family protein [Selenomonas sp.]|nr:histidine phosphatase family protein [Selenomonas sp.]
MITKEKYGYKRILALIVFCLCLALTLPVQAAKNDEPVTTVILVRHGQTDYNKENRYQGFLDIPLNEKGLAQADQLAASLKDVHIDVFIGSALSGGAG